MATLFVASGLFMFPAHTAAAGNDPTHLIIGFIDAVPQHDGTYLGAPIIDQNDAIHYIVVATDRPTQLAARAILQGDVRYINVDRDEALPTATTNDPKRGDQWALEAADGIDAYGAWDTTMGSTDIVVAVIDSGVDANHPDIGNLVSGYDIVRGDSDPDDECGHGTHIVGSVNGLADNGVGIAGVAQVSVMPLKVIRVNSSGACTAPWSKVAEAITYATDNGADVISLSLGSAGSYSQSVSDALDYAWANGVFIVGASGNAGTSGVAFPAIHQHVMAVSALDWNGNVVSFSNHGPEVEIAAPGLSILSTLPGNKYGYKSGTSMAAPHVAAVAGLVLSADPSLDNQQLRTLLADTATDYGNPVNEQGAGGVDAAAAIAGLGAINQAPLASVTYTCATLACDFDGTGSTDADGAIAGYAWDLGDGNQAGGATWSHTYQAPGSYTVTLTVTDDAGADGATTETVVLEVATQPPTASFAQSCTDLACTFDGTASADSDGTIVSYTWDFGDGSTATGATASHTYGNGGSYTVSLTVTDDDGSSDTKTTNVAVTPANQAPLASMSASCADLTCSFDGSASSDPDGTITAHAWDLGDGNTATGATASHIYGSAGTYTVTLTATDEGGSTDTTMATITVTAPNQPPTARLTAACTDLSCTFDGGQSTDPDGTITSYSWDFGDGASGTGTSPSHVYTAAGTYTATLTVTDSDSATDAESMTVTVSAPTVNEAPDAWFRATCAGRACSFDGTGSTDPEGPIVQYTWSFGDGDAGTGATTAHTYDSNGRYTVQLTVTDEDGATDTYTVRVNAKEVPNRLPTARFTSSCDGRACTFDASASTDPDGRLADYAWDFGDGVIVGGRTVAHDFASNGDHQVRLTVTDKRGATDEVTKTVTAWALENEAPDAYFTVTCTGTTCVFDASGSTDADGGIVSYTWDLGDGNAGSGAHFVHDYGTSTIVRVTLTVTDDNGLADQSTKRIRVQA